MKTVITFALLVISVSISHAQNVGIGTNTPAYPLTVIAKSAKGIVQKDGDVEIGFFTSSIGGYLQTWSNHPLLFATNNGSAAMILGTNGNLGIGTLVSFNNTHRLYVNGESFLFGNVGIGIAPTNEMLHVAGNATIDALKVVNTLKAGNTEVSSIKIGAIGTTVSALQLGSLTVGPGATQQIEATLVFPSSFASIPRLFVMPKHQPGFINNDAFSVTIKTISTTQATLVIRRLDSNAAWNQNLVIDWLAIR